MNESSHLEHIITTNTTIGSEISTTKSTANGLFVYIVCGTKQLFFKKNNISYTSGELIYISEKTTISFLNIPDKESGYLEVEVQLPKHLLFSLFTEEPADENALLSYPLFGYSEKVISETVSEKLKTILHSLHPLLQTLSSNRAEVCEIMRIDIVRLIRASEQRFIARKLHHDLTTASQNVIDITQQAVLADKNLSEVAAMGGLPLSSFKQEFKKATGATPYNWIVQQRLTHARFLLLSTGKSVKTIASKCCFNAESHFSKLFRREFGITPSGYRKKIESAMKAIAATEIK